MTGPPVRFVNRGIAEVWQHQYQLGHFVDTQDNYGSGFSTFCRLFLAMGLGPRRRVDPKATAIKNRH